MRGAPGTAGRARRCGRVERALIACAALVASLAGIRLGLDLTAGAEPRALVTWAFTVSTALLGGISQRHWGHYENAVAGTRLPKVAVRRSPVDPAPGAAAQEDVDAGR